MKESFNLQKEARTLDVTTTFLQRMARASEEAGEDASMAAGRFEKFEMVIGEVREGSKEAAAVFQSMGVSPFGKTMEENLLAVAQAFDKMTDPAERARKAVELFGRGGQEMLPVLKQLAEGGGSYAQALGMSDAQTDSILGGSYRKIKAFFNDVKNVAKAAGKEYLANEIQGLTGYAGESGPNPSKVSKVMTAAEKEAQAKRAEENIKAIARAQREYHQEVERTADAQIRLAMQMAGCVRDSLPAVASGLERGTASEVLYLEKGGMKTKRPPSFNDGRLLAVPGARVQAHCNRNLLPQNEASSLILENVSLPGRCDRQPRSPVTRRQGFPHSERPKTLPNQSKFVLDERREKSKTRQTTDS
jgi:hypothetical protein